VIETESYLFLGKQIIAPSPASSIKLGATVLIASHHFSLLSSHLPLASPFTSPWLTPPLMPPLLSSLRRPTSMTRARLQDRKHCDDNLFFSNSRRCKNGGGGNPETHRVLQEDDRDRRRPSSIPRPWMADR
jgi:hypothetical protein